MERGRHLRLVGEDELATEPLFVLPQDSVGIQRFQDKRQTYDEILSGLASRTVPIGSAPLLMRRAIIDAVIVRQRISIWEFREEFSGQNFDKGPYALMDQETFNIAWEGAAAVVFGYCISGDFSVIDPIEQELAELV
jgi:hypothetical protein